MLIIPTNLFINRIQIMFPVCAIISPAHLKYANIVSDKPILFKIFISFNPSIFRLFYVLLSEESFSTKAIHRIPFGEVLIWKIFVNTKSMWTILPCNIQTVNGEIANCEHYNDNHEHFGCLATCSQLAHRTRISARITSICKWKWKCVLNVHTILRCIYVVFTKHNISEC